MPSDTFDWRQHAKQLGVPTWKVWTALRHQTASIRMPSDQVHVVSPRDVDRLAADPERVGVVRDVIDDLAGGK